MTEERQPNTELREETLRRLIADDSASWHQTVAQAYDAGQAEAQQQIERLEKGIKAFKEYEECAERQIKGLEQQAEHAEKQLAEARAQAFREAAEIARSCPSRMVLDRMITRDEIAAALERAAEEVK